MCSRKTKEERGNEQEDCPWIAVARRQHDPVGLRRCRDADRRSPQADRAREAGRHRGPPDRRPRADRRDGAAPASFEVRVEKADPAPLRMTPLDKKFLRSLKITVDEEPE